MGNSLTTQGVFKDSEFGELEVLSIDGKEYFPATACAKMLGYTNPKKAVRDHCTRGNVSFPVPGKGGQERKYIPEGDLYRLIIRSKLTNAERFERWVMDEVLPTIRKRGAYAVPQADMLSIPVDVVNLMYSMMKLVEDSVAATKELAESVRLMTSDEQILLPPLKLPKQIVTRNNIWWKRKDRHYSQQELGRKVGVCPATINQWEHGARRPTDEQFGKLADALGCTVIEIKYGFQAM
ncbi:hypothetical protein FACS1894202_03720 [Clostridia bacterium]|nr:hypothetical protein FACS1894202_03720 [Clostridia bacterium]